MQQLEYSFDMADSKEQYGTLSVPVYERSWQRRQVRTREGSKTKAKVTVLTYNILNDEAVKAASTKRGGYGYCPKSTLDMASRHRHIVHEMALLEPDVVCMQEVNPDPFETKLRADMADLKYGAVYSGQGEATFFRKDVFELQDSKSFAFSDLIEHELDDSELDPDERRAILEHCDHPQKMILAVLRHKESDDILHVANVHILWGSLKFVDVQTLQICLAAKALARSMEDGGVHRYVMCGDFNTPPDYPAYHLLRGSGTMDAICRERLTTSPPVILPSGKGVSLLERLTKSFRIDLPFHSSYHRTLGTEPLITNCDDGDGGAPTELCLDYIWFSPETLDVAAVLETPPREDIVKHTALPSVLFPSDHIPLMAELIML